MEDVACYENYPRSTVALANLQTASVYALGVVILSGFGIVVAFLFLAYCVGMVFSVLRRSCVNCYYYGKTCFSGWGRVSSRIFKRGDPQTFATREVSWLVILPDLLVTIVPMIGGIVLLVISFSWFILGAMIAMLVLSMWGAGLIRGRLACRHCKQRGIGCPAEKLFEKGPGASG